MMQKLLWAAFVCCTTVACTPKTEVSSPDGSIRLTLKDGSEVIAIKAVPSTEATAK